MTSNKVFGFLLNICVFSLYDRRFMWCEYFFYNFPEEEWMWGGTRITLQLLLLGRPSDAQHVSCFFPCRSAISCSPPHPFRTSHSIRQIYSSGCSLYTTCAATMLSSAGPHVKSRCPQYPGSNIKRFPVPDAKVDWTQNWPQYNPVSYTDPSVAKKPAWADPDIGWATHT